MDELRNPIGKLYALQSSMLEHKNPPYPAIIDSWIEAAGDIYREHAKSIFIDYGYIGEKMHYNIRLHKIREYDWFDLRGILIQMRDSKASMKVYHRGYNYDKEMKAYLKKVRELIIITESFDFEDLEERREPMLTSLLLIHAIGTFGVSESQGDYETVRALYFELEDLLRPHVIPEEEKPEPEPETEEEFEARTARPDVAEWTEEQRQEAHEDLLKFLGIK